MRRRIYIIGLIFVFAFAQKAVARSYETEGDYQQVLVEKEFAFSADKTLKIRNQRGSVIIKNWDKPQVSITITLVADINSKRKLEKLIDNSEVFISKDGWSFESKCTEKISLRNESFSFEYSIYAPENLKIDLETTFGDIGVESISNDSRIRAKFATLQLNNGVENSDIPLQLSLEFADDVHIGTVSHLDIEAKFSTIEIDKVDNIKTDTRFSKITVDGETPLVRIDSKHDKMSWEVVGDFKTDDMEFTTLQIEKLLKNLILEDVRFGKIKVEEIAEDFENIDIEAEFTPVKLDVKNLSYKLDLGTKFGNIEISKDAVIKEKEKEMNSLYLKAVKEGKGKLGNIKVRSRHAKISIK